MATTKLMTAEDLLQLDDDEYRYDLLRGELIRMSPATFRHGRLGMQIARKIADYADEHGLGVVPNSETGFLLARDPDVVLAPDVAFVRMEQVPPVEEQDRFLALAPDLVVEVASPSDRLTEINDKITEYLDAGVALAWVIEPKRKRVTVYTPDRRSQMFAIDDELDGGDVLPGFKLPVADIFR